MFSGFNFFADKFVKVTFFTHNEQSVARVSLGSGVLTEFGFLTDSNTEQLGQM